MPATRLAPHSTVPLRELRARAFVVPTPTPESDGTLEWDSTTLVVITARAGDVSGLGYTYASTATAVFINDTLWPALEGMDALAVSRCWRDMARTVRNAGRPGVASTAISAVDCALWDLKARIIGLPLVVLLDAAREDIPAYGSGGFTSESIADLCRELANWVDGGLTRVKMKVGRDAAADRVRVAEVRRAIGPSVELFVDANGAYARKQALAQAEQFAASGVTWFEEPVSSDDVSGLRLIRDRAPAGMTIAAGEYAYIADDFRRLIENGAVDCLQADATRCGGVTGFLTASALCQAHHLPLSTHTAPSLHAHLACAALPAVHVEYFADHARIEQLLFEGARAPHDGMIGPDRSRPGLGLELKQADAARYEV